MRAAANKVRNLTNGVPAEGERKCARCGETKPLTNFRVMLQKASGRDSYCESCRRAIGREWRRANRASSRASVAKWQKANPLASRLSKYPIDTTEYLRRLDEQDSSCAICGRSPDDPFTLCVDHDHATGKVRGLLCSACNSGLGKLGDTEEGLLRALDYLRRTS